MSERCRCDYRETGGDIVDGVHSVCGLALRTSSERMGELIRATIDNARNGYRAMGFSDAEIDTLIRDAMNASIRRLHKTTNVAGMSGPSTLMNGDGNDRR